MLLAIEGAATGLLELLSLGVPCPIAGGRIRNVITLLFARPC